MNLREQLTFLDGVERELERLDRSIMLAEWSLYTGRSLRGPGRLETRRAKILTRPAVTRWTAREPIASFGASARRRHELLRREVIDAQSEQHPSVLRLRQRLQRQIVAFRPGWEGRRVGRARIYDILRRDPDARHRRRALYAEEPLLRPMEPDLVALIQLRNDRARTLGFRSYVHLRLAFEGFTPESLVELIDRVLAFAPSRIRAFRDAFLSRTRRSTWYPWDLPYARNDRGALPDAAFSARSMIPDVKLALRAWGFRGPALGFRVARHDLPFGGLTIVPHVPDDVRVIVHPRGGWEYYSVLFHEFGHAVHAATTRAPTHLLRNGLGFPAFHEGVADLFEEISLGEEWLRGRPRLRAAQIREFRKSRADENLVRACLTGLGFLEEWSVYQRPDRDPRPAHHRRLKRLFGFGEYPWPSWAGTFAVTHPVYFQSYLLALLFRKQVLAQILREVEGPLWPNSRVGPWLTEQFLRRGSVQDWVPRVREVTGHPFGVESFLQSVRRREP